MYRRVFFSVIAFSCLSCLPVKAQQAAGAAKAEPTGYLKTVLEFYDTLITDGTDRYGPEHSPMFCAILDLETHRLPDEAPPLLKGQRGIDRTYPGGNMHQDMLTLVGMYHASKYTGRQHYAKAADAYLEFFLRRCAAVGNGLFPCGEHAFWDFRNETIQRPTHEELALFPVELLDRCWVINPGALARHILALHNHIVDTDRWLWNRHANITGKKRTSCRSFPRHGGFYLYHWAYLYDKTGDPQLLEWAKKTAEVPWSQRHPKSGNIPCWLKGDSKHPGDHDKTLCTPMGSLSLGLSVIAANRLLGEATVPQWDEIGRGCVDSAISPFAHHDPKNGLISTYVHNDGTEYSPKWNKHHKSYWALRLGFWDSAYSSSGGLGFSGAEKFSILCLATHRATGNPAHLQFAKDVWDYYQTQTPPPKGAEGITPGKFAGLIALSLDLYDLTGEQKYLDWARETADRAVEELYAKRLFRAATGADYYEAANGAGSLAFELFRLHLALTRDNYPLPRNYYDS